MLTYIHHKIMPNTKSAIRRVRRVKIQTQTNRIRKSKYKNAIKQMDLFIKSKDKDKAKKYFSKFQSILMQVAKSGVVSKGTASRKISRISKKI
jgi:small subunit ribosomal protein S20